MSVFACLTVIDGVLKQLSGLEIPRVANGDTRYAFSFLLGRVDSVGESLWKIVDELPDEERIILKSMLTSGGRFFHFSVIIRTLVQLAEVEETIEGAAYKARMVQSCKASLPLLQTSLNRLRDSLAKKV